MGVGDLMEASNSKMKLEHRINRITSSIILSIMLCALVSGGILLILSYFPIDWIYSLIILVVINLIYIGIALIKNFHLKKFKKGKIGILLAIDDKGEYEGYKIKNDLLNELNESLDTKKFQLICVSNYWAKKIKRVYKEEDDILKYHNKIGGMYWIVGSTEKEKDGGYKCFIKSNALVFHGIIPDIVENELGTDFSKMYLKDIEFNDDYYKSGIEFSGIYNGIVAKYIIGVAFLVSGAPLSARNIHKGLHNELSEISKINKINHNINESYFKFIGQKIKIIQYRELQYISDYYYQTGKRTERINWLNVWQKLSEEYNVFDSGLLNHQAIYEFLENRNIKLSKKLIKRAGEKGYEWYRYSLVFLDLWDKNYKGAKLNMRKIIKKGCNYTVVLESVIKFIDDILDEYEDRFEFLYREALIYYKQEYNLPLAFQKLEKYLGIVGDNKYGYELDDPKQLFNKIKAEMKIEDF